MSLVFYPAEPLPNAPFSYRFKNPNAVIPLSMSKDGYASKVLDGNQESAKSGAVFTVPKQDSEAYFDKLVHAELEIHVSNHANDEFYYQNLPDELAQPTSGIFGKGPFKQLEVYIDNVLVGK